MLPTHIKLLSESFSALPTWLHSTLFPLVVTLHSHHRSSLLTFSRILTIRNRLLAPNGSIPVFRYEYFGNIPSVSPKPWLGAYHASELPMIFGTYDDYRADMNNGTMEKAAQNISHAMQDAWLAFMTAGARGLEERGWPRYTGAMTGQIRMFGVNDTAVMTGSAADEDALCPKVAETLDP